MNISRYHIFCRVVDLGSFTKAAGELGYTQSAVSQIIKTLEAELGTVLLERRRGGIRLTSDGKQYLPYLRSLSGAEIALHEKQKEMDGLESSNILIDTFTSVSRNILPPLLRSFRELYPGVSFVLRQGDYASIRDDLLSGRVDLGFLSPGTFGGESEDAVAGISPASAETVSTNAKHPAGAGGRQSWSGGDQCTCVGGRQCSPGDIHFAGSTQSRHDAPVSAGAFAGLQMEKLYDDDMVAVLPREHPLAMASSVSLKDLSRETLILLDEGAEYNTALEGFRRAGLTPAIGYEVYDDYTIMSMIRQGLGVSLLFRRVVHGFSEGVEIREIREALTRPVYLAWKNRDTLPIAARRFADYILANVGQERLDQG